ncbi:hypothetical protein GUJ93_ZPchr0004g39106 [Zizania palustris]|uniref:Uncharacterized protein n=1 Tax=Zizania palustris TaxID=103762 RepID=A0A8J5VYL1_ZIZPA|nr:hypothetical protein GUJ93_ZPchr0004g39106 [Zizania palustris]
MQFFRVVSILVSTPSLQDFSSTYRNRWSRNHQYWGLFLLNMLLTQLKLLARICNSLDARRREEAFHAQHVNADPMDEPMADVAQWGHWPEQNNNVHQIAQVQEETQCGGLRIPFQGLFRLQVGRVLQLVWSIAVVNACLWGSIYHLLTLIRGCHLVLSRGWTKERAFVCQTHLQSRISFKQLQMVGVGKMLAPVRENVKLIPSRSSSSMVVDAVDSA